MPGARLAWTATNSSELWPSPLDEEAASPADRKRQPRRSWKGWSGGGVNADMAWTRSVHTG